MKQEDLIMGLFKNGELQVEIEVGDMNYLETDELEKQYRGEEYKIGYRGGKEEKYKDGIK